MSPGYKVAEDIYALYLLSYTPTRWVCLGFAPRDLVLCMEVTPAFGSGDHVLSCQRCARWGGELLCDLENATRTSGYRQGLFLRPPGES